MTNRRFAYVQKSPVIGHPTLFPAEALNMGNLLGFWAISPKSATLWQATMGTEPLYFRAKGVVQKSRVAEQFRLRMMDYDNYFREHLEALHREGRYRVFADLKRRCGAYPAADQFTGKGTRDVTVWCSNDYLGMSQHPRWCSPPCTRRSTPSAPAPAARATSPAPPIITSSSRPSSPICTARRQRSSSPRPMSPTTRRSRRWQQPASRAA